MSRPERTESESRVWTLGPGGYMRAAADNPHDFSYVLMRCQGPELHEEVEVVPRSVAEALAEALTNLTTHGHAGHFENCASTRGPVACDCGFSDALKSLVAYLAAYPREETS